MSRWRVLNLPATESSDAAFLQSLGRAVPVISIMAAEQMDLLGTNIDIQIDQAPNQRHVNLFRQDECLKGKYECPDWPG